jgi:hypothetical protein
VVALAKEEPIQQDSEDDYSEPDTFFDCFSQNGSDSEEEEHVKYYGSAPEDWFKQAALNKNRNKWKDVKSKKITGVQKGILQ